MAGGAPFYGEIMRHCKFCKKPREVPTYRIFTEDGTFDEVACNTHGNLLEKLADLELGDKERHHIISSNNINCKYCVGGTCFDCEANFS
jgi:hypothetical protein